MLSGLTAAAIIADATSFFAEIDTAVLVAAGCLLAFAVGKYAVRLIKKGAH